MAKTKPVTKIDDKALLAAFVSKTTAPNNPPNTPEPVMQKVVPVRRSKRENQEQVGFWCNIKLKKRLQMLAIQEGVELTDLFIEAARDLLKSRGIEWNELKDEQ